MFPMETNLYTITIPAIKRALENLSKILDKAEEHAASKATEKRPTAVHMEALLNDRLIFDQFTLLRQIQVATDNAKGGAARLAGIEPPKFEDSESTVEELKTRIDKTIQFLDTITHEMVVGQEARKVELAYYAGKHFTAFDYATQYLLPNFYFHVVTAYDIARKNGVPIGKSDFIGSLSLHDNA